MKRAISPYLTGLMAALALLTLVMLGGGREEG